MSVKQRWLDGIMNKTKKNLPTPPDFCTRQSIEDSFAYTEPRDMDTFRNKLKAKVKAHHKEDKTMPYDLGFLRGFESVYNIAICQHRKINQLLKELQLRDTNLLKIKHNHMKIDEEVARIIKSATDRKDKRP